MIPVLESEVDAKLHRAVAGVHVAAAQEIMGAAGGGGINGVFRNNAGDPAAVALVENANPGVGWALEEKTLPRR